MDKITLKRIVIETLGFDPEEFLYKLREHQRELDELKDILKNTLPVIGTNILEGQLIKTFLASKGLDPEEYIAQGVKEFSKQKNEMMAQAQLESKQKRKQKKKDSLPAPETKGIQ